MGQGRQDIGGFLYSEEDVKWGVNKKGYRYNLAGLDFRITQFFAWFDVSHGCRIGAAVSTYYCNW